MVAFRGLLCLAVPAAILLAIAFPCPAQDASSDQAKALLKQGTEQFNNLDFSAAKASLLQVDKKYLTPEEARTLASYLGRVDEAIRQQANALEAYRSAEDALKAGQLENARQGFAAAAGNEYLPGSKRQQAKEQMDLVCRKIQAAGASAAGPTGEAMLASQPTNPETEQRMMQVVAARKEQVQGLLSQGDDAMSKGQFTRAAELYDQALSLQPDLEETKQKLAVARQRASGADASPLSNFMQDLQVRRQRADFQFREAIDRARAALQPAGRELKREDFQVANDAAAAAQDVLVANRRLFSAEQYNDRAAQVDALRKDIASRQETWERNLAAAQAHEARTEEARRVAEQERQRQLKLDTMVARAKTLMAEQNYEQALAQMDEILKNDPQNPYALANRTLLEQLVFMRSEGHNDDARQIQEQRSLGYLREQEIPWNVYLHYPENWKDLTATRQPIGSSQTDTEQDRQIKAKLGSVLKDVNFNKVEFRRVVDWLQDVGGVNIVVNWGAMEGAEESQVDLKLTNVTLEKVLRLVLDQVAKADRPLDFVIGGGVITISSREDLNQKTYVEVYDINDLIYTFTSTPEPTAYALGDLSPQGNTNQMSQKGGGGAGMGIFGSSTTTGGGGTEEQKTITRDDLVKTVQSLITTTVEPTSWPPDGEIGRISELHGQLIIRQTAAAHKAIAILIDKLRQARAIQVAIESRFVRVNTGFLNSIGVDLDFYFNIGSRLGSGTVTDPWTGATVPTKIGTSGWGRDPKGTNLVTPIPVQQNSNTFMGLSPSAPILGGTSIGDQITGSALHTFGTFLDDIQVNFLLDATQAHSSTRSLASPRLTLFNGQSAYIQVQTTRAYVADLTPVVSENSTAYDIDIGQVGTGTYLWVYATVSADRRYVTMSVAPTVQNLVSLTFFPYDPSTVIAGGTVPDAAQSFVQLPTVEVQTLKTTVSVPDGGTLLIGGQNLAAEIDQDVGVPVLSKVPILNRFFDNRRKTRDEQTLLILIKPKILIQQEQEGLAFP